MTSRVWALHRRMCPRARGRLSQTGTEAGEKSGTGGYLVVQSGSEETRDALRGMKQ
jgi:hypothetical protein